MKTAAGLILCAMVGCSSLRALISGEGIAASAGLNGHPPDKRYQGSIHGQRDDLMKIVFATENGEYVSTEFCSCPYSVVLEVERGQIVARSMRRNTPAGYSRGRHGSAGGAGHGIGCVVCLMHGGEVR